MRNSFSGFPADLFAFLSELASNNNREWFNANKQRYHDSVVAPMGVFITAMGGRLEELANCFVADPRPHGGSMFRIYRDTRFARDKRPYKENVGCQFRHEAGKDAHAPGFYVHLSPHEVFFGGGIWKPPGPVLARVREAIAEKPKAWKQAVSGQEFAGRFGGVMGDTLKRPPRGFDASHPLIEDIKRKSFYAMQQVSPSLALTPRFIDEIEQAFIELRPMMRFLTTATGFPFSR